MMLLAIAIFAGALALMATDEVDRTKVALLGASAVAMIGALLSLIVVVGALCLAVRRKPWIERDARDRVMELDASRPARGGASVPGLRQAL